MVLSLILVHFIQFLILIGVKLLLFLEKITACSITAVHQFILTIRKKDILVPNKDPTQGLDDTTITAEEEYSINFSRSQRKFYFIFIITEATFFYPLIPLKSINSKQKTLK